MAHEYKTAEQTNPPISHIQPTAPISLIIKEAYYITELVKIFSKQLLESPFEDGLLNAFYTAPPDQPLAESIASDPNFSENIHKLTRIGLLERKDGEIWITPAFRNLIQEKLKPGAALKLNKLEETRDLLINAGHDKESVQRMDGTALVIAASKSNQSDIILQPLFEAEINLDHILDKAVETGDLELALYLREKGVKINMHEYTLIEVTYNQKMNGVKMLPLLLSYIKSLPSAEVEATGFVLPVKDKEDREDREDIDYISEITDSDPDALSYLGKSVSNQAQEYLMQAIDQYQPNRVETLLRAGVNPNSQNDKGETALSHAIRAVNMSAAVYDKTEVISLLLQHGASVEIIPPGDYPRIGPKVFAILNEYKSKQQETKQQDDLQLQGSTQITAPISSPVSAPPELSGSTFAQSTRAAAETAADNSTHKNAASEEQSCRTS